MRAAGEARLDFAWPIDLALTVASHGWVHLAPWRWDPETGRLARVERIAGTPGMIAVRQRDPASILVEWTGFAPRHAGEAAGRVRRWVSADWDPAPAIAALRAEFPAEAGLVACGGGRLLRGSSFYEDFVKTVLTINTNWSATCRMVAAVVAEPGGGAFPTPGDVLDYGETRLRERSKLGFRGATLIAATRQMLADGVIDAEGEGAPELLDYAYLTGLKGIGPYAAAHCRMLLQDFARLPVDSIAAAFFRDRVGIAPAAFATGGTACSEFPALAYRLLRLRETLARAEPAPPFTARGRPADRSA